MSPICAFFGQAVANSQGPDWTADTTRLLFRGREMQGNDSTLEASARELPFFSSDTFGVFVVETRG